jgi:hypothetical protein
LPQPSKHDGAIYPRKDGNVLWMVYRDRSGKRIRESTNTDDWQEAQRKLRERLQTRDDKVLDVVRKGEQLQLADWVDFFLENYSKPPMRRVEFPVKVKGLFRAHYLNWSEQQRIEFRAPE